ncbi:MAG: hypothetical protein ACM3JG_05810 [Thiohalocapsa sp.]
MATALTAAVIALPCAAAPPEAPLDLSGMPGVSAEQGKPAIVPPGQMSGSAGAAGTRPCAAPLPCGSRLIGSVRKNGAVELQVPALRW